MYKAITATKLPTLTSDDLKLFKALMQDTWPQLHVERDGSADLEAAIRKVLQTWQLEAVPEQV